MLSCIGIHLYAQCESYVLVAIGLYLIASIVCIDIIASIVRYHFVIPTSYLPNTCQGNYLSINTTEAKSIHFVMACICVYCCVLVCVGMYLVHNIMY